MQNKHFPGLKNVTAQVNVIFGGQHRKNKSMLPKILSVYCFIEKHNRLIYIKCVKTYYLYLPQDSQVSIS